MALAAGTKLGPYEILVPIGAGGMGEVYRARDAKLNRDVAIKVLHSLFANDAERMARFHREAQVLASLNHPNIGSIYGLEESSDILALVLELVEGPTLAERVGNGPLPLDEAVHTARQIVEALEYAHDRGIIHRDLKPANIKVTPEGVVKVLDFGLAKALEDEPASSLTQNSPTLTLGHTRAGVILGTAAYMSPEQAVGKPADRRSDIFSFGAVLFEMLTGRRAFNGESAGETLVSVAKDEPDWSHLPASTPSSMIVILRRCLTKDRKRRLQAIGEVRIAFENPVPDEPPPHPASSQVRRMPWLWPMLSGVFALTAIGFAALWLHPSPPPQVVLFEIHAPPRSTLPIGTPAITEDGKMLAFTVNDPDGMRRIHVRPIDRIETRALPGTEGAIHPYWSPDGRSLAFSANGRLKRIDIEGGAARDLADARGPWHGTWGPHGDILFFNSSINRVLAEGGQVTNELRLDEKKGETLQGSGFPTFLADGKRFLLSVGGEKGSIQLGTVGSAGRTMVLDDVVSAPLLAPTPKGKTYLLFLRGPDLFGEEFDSRTGTVRGKLQLVVSNVGQVANPAIRPAAGISAAGILAYQTGGTNQTGQLTWYDRSGKTVEALPADASGKNPRLSPTGGLVAVERRSQTVGPNIWVTDLSRKSSFRLTFSVGRDVNATWSPDGKRLAYLSLAAKGGGIHIVDIGDTAKDQILETSVRDPESWSPDGKYLLVGTRSGELNLIVLNGERKPVRVGSQNGHSFQGQISPDGKFIAFTSDESGRNEVYAQPMPPATGSPKKISISGGLSPRWRHNGTELFFVSPDDSIMAADVKLGAEFSAGVPHPLFQVKGADRLDLTNYDVRADGQRFLIFMAQQQDQDASITVVMNWWAELRREP